MGVVHSVETELGKELAKHEQHRTKFTSDEVPPGNPYQYREYGTSGKMLYKAQYHPRRKRMECMIIPIQSIAFATVAEAQADEQYVEQFNRSCTRIVHTADEERIAKNDGWCASPQLAMEECERRRAAIGDVTAQRHFTDQRMGANARAEARAADDADGEHVADVPAPRKKRGRKPNAPMVTVPEMPPPTEDLL